MVKNNITTDDEFTEDNNMIFIIFGPSFVILSYVSSIVILNTYLKKLHTYMKTLLTLVPFMC